MVHVRNARYNMKTKKFQTNFWTLYTFVVLIHVWIQKHASFHTRVFIRFIVLGPRVNAYIVYTHQTGRVLVTVHRNILTDDVRFFLVDIIVVAVLHFFFFVCFRSELFRRIALCFQRRSLDSKNWHSRRRIVTKKNIQLINSFEF